MYLVIAFSEIREYISRRFFRRRLMRQSFLRASVCVSLLFGSSSCQQLCPVIIAHPSIVRVRSSAQVEWIETATITP
jgi:hypothetical protein